MFIGRQTELKILKDGFAKGEASLFVIYGRRRIGKSSLILEGAKGCKFYSLEGLENQETSAQKKVFIEQLVSLNVKTNLTAQSSWYLILSELVKLIDANESTVILLDELQWLANYRSELISNIKLVWDQKLSKYENCHLVLCGSVASFMVDKVIKSKALYGRSQATINLGPFTLKETSSLLSDKSFDEVLLAQLLVGGVPKYLNLLRDKSSVLLSLAFHCQGKNAYFVHEYEKIFVSHFGSKTHYDKIIRFLNSKLHGAGRNEIASETASPNSGQLTKLLVNLEHAGMIQAFTPFDRKASSKIKLYKLVDNFMRFYLTFIEPLIDHGEIQRIDLINQVFSSPKMHSWLGESFEVLCLNHISQIAKALEFSAVRYSAGPFLQSKRASKRKRQSQGEVGAAQLDLVFKRKDGVYTVCELKYASKLNLKEIARSMNAAIAKVKVLENASIQKVLISDQSISTLDEADGVTFNKILSIEELVK